ncbi:MAG: hypothetical protein R3F60_16645 [bacterium]
MRDAPEARRLHNRRDADPDPVSTASIDELGQGAVGALLDETFERTFESSSVITTLLGPPIGFASTVPRSRAPRNQRPMLASETSKILDASRHAIPP